ncbi:MAG TPA: hypothetical protein V6C57_27165 [Coleofasciculaceae cyanobacterium]
MMMNRLLRTISLPLHPLVKRISYFILGTVLTVFYAQVGHAQSSGSPAITQNPYSVETILAAVMGAVITLFFLRGMYLVLTYASETYGFGDDDDLDSSDEVQENNALLYGAFGWVAGSALVIASYGLGWGFLYIGPIVCLLGPVVPIVAMNLDIKKYREILAARARRSPASY